MFWTGFIAGLLTPVAGFLLWLLYSWLTVRSTVIECRCGKNFGVLPSWVRQGVEKENGELYKRPTLDRVTRWQHRFHWWFKCPVRR